MSGATQTWGWGWWQQSRWHCWWYSQWAKVNAPGPAGMYSTCWSKAPKHCDLVGKVLQDSDEFWGQIMAQTGSLISQWCPHQQFLKTESLLGNYWYNRNNDLWHNLYLLEDSCMMDVIEFPLLRGYIFKVLTHILLLITGLTIFVQMCLMFSPASVSYIQVAGFSCRSFRSLRVPIILESTMLWSLHLAGEANHKARSCCSLMLTVEWDKLSGSASQEASQELRLRGPTDPGSEHSSATAMLCDNGQVNQSLWASV